jgi:hypothetical protein
MREYKTKTSNNDESNVESNSKYYHLRENRKSRERTMREWGGQKGGSVRRKLPLSGCRILCTASTTVRVMRDDAQAVSWLDLLTDGADVAEDNGDGRFCVWEGVEVEVK